VRAAFRTVRRLADDLGLPERSMGMSGDLEAAVAEGSTMVRIGTDLVGELQNDVSADLPLTRHEQPSQRRRNATVLMLPNSPSPSASTN